MFNFKIDPKTKLVETATSSDSHNVVNTPSTPVTQADISGDLTVAKQKDYSDWVGDIDKKEKTPNTSTTEEKSSTTTENAENTAQPKTDNKKKDESVKGIDIMAENEKVVDDFAEGEID